jgi:hypothetical protein
MKRLCMQQEYEEINIEDETLSRGASNCWCFEGTQCLRLQSKVVKKE